MAYGEVEGIIPPGSQTSSMGIVATRPLILHLHGNWEERIFYSSK